MKVIIGSARRDENGKYAGGKPGDQDGVEVSTQNCSYQRMVYVPPPE